jgi:hypothetical protein
MPIYLLMSETIDTDSKIDSTILFYFIRKIVKKWSPTEIRIPKGIVSSVQKNKTTWVS